VGSQGCSNRTKWQKSGKIVQTKAPKIYSKDLIETIFKHPYCKSQFLEEAGLAKRQTAANYLQTLAELGLLSSIKVGRERYYINKGLLEVLRE
jgi:Fic family protein